MNESLRVSGLEAPVEIAIDRWGVPHIRAQNLRDLFFGQGFNAARDRLWQIDLWRKRGLGVLAADFGPGFLAQDWASRLFLYRGDMDAEWAAYGPDAKSICESFVSGINAYVDFANAEPVRLPPEFGVSATRPARWRADDVVRIRTHGLLRNAASEIVRANVMAHADVETDLLRMNLEPPITPFVADGLDLGAIPLSALDLYRLAVAPVTFSEDRLQASIGQAWEWTNVTPAGDVERLERPTASNNWAVDGRHTASGRPILASDPHRAHTQPSLRYLVHLTSPEIDVIGAVEPNFPGITIGHNGHAAFGLTLFLGPDQEDVYVYETTPAMDAYRYGDQWEAIRIVSETFQVKGTGSQTLPMKFTRHGAVIYENAPTTRAMAIRSIWSEPGTAPYGAGLLAMRATNFDQFRDAMRKWNAPAVNQVYADRDGEIAWVTAAMSPIRRNWDGLLPVPGDGRYEWDGFLDRDVLPMRRNPASGFVASANAMNLPSDWSYLQHPLGHEWDDPARARRIEELLRGQTSHTLAMSRAMQNDVVSIPARRLCALLEQLDSDDADASAALSLLREWDARVSVESGAAALFEVWWSNYLRPALLAALVPDDRVRGFVRPGDVESLVQALERPSPLLGGTARDEMLTETLAQAFGDCAARMGRDPHSWAWGWLHTLRIKNLDPIPLGGSESTLMKATYRASDFAVTMGASMRMVVDVGEWDNSVWINSPGQSGDPRSPHYTDLAGYWGRGEYVPMLYTADAVEDATEHKIFLTTKDAK